MRNASGTLHQDIDACVRDLREEMIAFTSELVAIASENPPGLNYRECVRLIGSRLRQAGLPCARIPFRSRKGPRDDSGAAIVQAGIGSGTRTLYFSGHCRSHKPVIL